MIVSPAGGVLYHLKALRFRRPLWSAHRAAVESFLNAHSPPWDQRIALVLVGSSGGYSLPRAWVRSWKRLVIVEPDPLARLIFRARMGLWKSLGFRGELTWVSRAEDFARTSEPSVVDTLDPSAIVVFCNFLGQVEGLMEHARARGDRHCEARMRAGLAALLSLPGGAQRPWLSYHDRWSGEIRPTQDLGVTWPVRASDEKLKDWFFVGAKSGELGEHSALEWLPGSVISAEAPPAINTNWHYWTWRLTPTVWHLIEATGTVGPTALKRETVQLSR